MQHEPEIERTPGGAPRLDAVIRRCEAEADGLLAYVNADVVLLDDFLPAIRMAADAGAGLIVGQCWNLDVDDGIDFTAGWGAQLRARALQVGVERGAGGIDYLVFRRGVFGAVPPFALGRAYFDNWLIWRARQRGACVVDVSSAVIAVHQNHDYSHLVGGRASAYEGGEAQRNLELAGGRLHLFNIDDATHRLVDSRVVKRRLAGVRAFPPARWLALEWGRARRAASTLLRPRGARLV